MSRAGRWHVDVKDQADDAEYASGYIVSHDQAKEERDSFSVGSASAVFENERFYEPAYHHREPEVDHPTPGCS